jgi:hypothetical protein
MHVPVSYTYDAYNYLSTATPQPLLTSPPQQQILNQSQLLQ